MRLVDPRTRYPQLVTRYPATRPPTGPLVVEYIGDQPPPQDARLSDTWQQPDGARWVLTADGWRSTFDGRLYSA